MLNKEPLLLKHHLTTKAWRYIRRYITERNLYEQVLLDVHRPVQQTVFNIRVDTHRDLEIDIAQDFYDNL